MDHVLGLKCGACITFHVDIPNCYKSRNKFIDWKRATCSTQYIKHIYIYNNACSIHVQIYHNKTLITQPYCSKHSLQVLVGSFPTCILFGLHAKVSRFIIKYTLINLIHYLFRVPPLSLEICIAI